MSKLLIHTALLCEAQAVIDFLKLKQDTSAQNLPQHCKLYTNTTTVLIVSGIGKENTFTALDFVFSNFEITKALNIGIAGCGDSSIKIGTLFCTNKIFPNINFAPITTVDEPLHCDEDLETLLVDMEAKYFLEVCKKHTTEITILKVVSDHLDTQIPKKAFVIELIQKSLYQWKHLLTPTV
jgi:nucleoside phosphorylase